MKRIASVVSLMILVTLVSCDYLLAPLKARENPNDALAPIQNLSVYPIDADTMRISFGWPASWESESPPAAVWIWVKQDSPPSSVTDAGAAEVLWADWATITAGTSYIYDYTPSTTPASGDTYYCGVFWTYDEGTEEEAADLEWAGPISDPAVMSTQSMSFAPTLDGFISSGWDAEDYTGTYLSFGIGAYNYVALLNFPSASFPANIASAVLNLSYFSGNVGQQMQVELVSTAWDDTTSSYAVASSFGFVDTSTNPVDYTIPADLTAKDELSIDVSSLVTAWAEAETPRYGFRLSKTAIATSVYSADYDVSEYRPSLRINYYGEETEE